VILGAPDRTVPVVPRDCVGRQAPALLSLRPQLKTCAARQSPKRWAFGQYGDRMVVCGALFVCGSWELVLGDHLKNSQGRRPVIRRAGTVCGSEPLWRWKSRTARWPAAPKRHRGAGHSPSSFRDNEPVQTNPALGEHRGIHGANCFKLAIDCRQDHQWQK